MNFSTLKSQFLLYLSDKLTKEGKEDEAKQVLSGSPASIFQYFSAFKEYLSKNAGGAKGIDSISITDLDKLEFKNGKFTIADEDNDFIKEALNSILSDETIKENLDKNKDGLSKDEAMNFLSGLSKDGKVSLDNLNNGIKKLNGNNSGAENIQDNSQANVPNPVSIDDVLSDKNIAAIFSLNSKDGTTEGDKNLAERFLSSLGGKNGQITEDSVNNLIKLFDADGDGNISAEDSKKAREKLSVLSGTDGQLTEEDFDVFGKFAASVFKKDSNMTADGLIDLIKTFDGDDSAITVEDFKKIKEYEGLGITPETQMTTESNAPDITSEEVPEEGTNNINSGTQNAGNTGGGGKGAFSPAVKDKDVSNMSIDELEQEKTNAQNAQEAAQQKYMDGVEKVDKELHTKIKELQSDIDKKQTEIDENNTKISQQTEAVQTAKDKISTAEGKITDITTKIGSLKEPTEAEYTTTDEEGNKVVDTKAYEAAKQAYREEKERLEGELEAAKQEKSDAETELQTAQTELDNLNTQKTTLEGELSELNTKMQDYEKEVDKLAETNPELKALKEEYDKSKEYLKNVENTLTKRKADQEKRESGDKLPLTYNLDGKEYHCVGISGIDTDGDGKDDFTFDSFEQFQQYMAAGGVANVGKYGTMQCFNYSQEYGEVIMGVADSRFTQALLDEAQGRAGDSDTAGKYATQSEYNKRNFAQVKSANRDEEYEVIKNELENGRPCVVSVPYPGGCHYALAVGMSDDGDVLIMDSYDCSMKKLGMSRSGDTKEHRNLATGNGVWIYMDGYSFSYGDKRGIDYAYYKAHGSRATLDQILQNRA